MSNATQRLNETKIMHNQMANSLATHQDVFYANLQGFLALARSVTWMMEKECDEVAGFKEWYAIKQDEMRANVDMRFLLKMRNVSLKEHSVGTATAYIKFPDGGMKLPAQAKMSVPGIKVTKDGFRLDESNNVVTIDGKPRPDIKFTVNLDYNFKERPDISAIKLCLEHFDKLKKIVKEYDEKFFS